jgi:hypothetical protein
MDADEAMEDATKYMARIAAERPLEATDTPALNVSKAIR